MSSPLPSTTVRGHGYGLTGMAERAELAGGTITAGPDGDHWTVDLAIPHSPP